MIYFSKIKSILIQILRVLQAFVEVHTAKVFWLSLGENCLTDNILQRHGVKSFSTPFSHSRSNIDDALMLERNNFEGLLEKMNLRYDYVGKTKVVRSTLYNTCETIYNELHMKGFEFSHHDIIASENKRKSLQRKIQRLKK